MNTSLSKNQMSPRPRVILLAALGLAACGPPPRVVPLVIDNVTVIDPAGGDVLAGHSVFIEGTRIAGIEPSGRGGAFVSTDSIDGTDRFVIPGLIDMHVHLFNRENVASPTLDLLLANGVTGFREMASDCWDQDRDGPVCTEALRAMSQEIREGTRVGPRPLGLSSAPINGVSQRSGLPEGAPPFLAPETEAEGRELARWLADRDIDLVKVYNSVPRDAYFGLMEEAAGIDLEVSGHLPLGVSVVEASNAGHRTIEHARDLPVACGDYSEPYRAIMARVVDGEDGVEAPSAEVRLRTILDAFDEARCARVLETLAANGTVLVPTHGTREMDYRASDSAYRADDRFQYMLEPIRDGWNRDLDRTAQASPELVELFGEFYALGLRLSGMAHAAGVQVLAGTDSNDTMIFPGFGLHDELERFGEAGISPMDVLRTATSASAEHLGEPELGTVSVGAMADLVILDQDPLAGIRNTRSIEWVILGGQVHDRAALDALLQGVEAVARDSAEG